MKVTQFEVLTERPSRDSSDPVAKAIKDTLGTSGCVSVPFNGTKKTTLRVRYLTNRWLAQYGVVRSRVVGDAMMFWMEEVRHKAEPK